MQEIVTANGHRGGWKGAFVRTKLRAASIGVCAAVLGGCHSYHASLGYEGRASAVSGGVSQGASVRLSTDGPLVGGLIIAVLLVEGVRYYLRAPDGSMTPLARPPESDPGRRVNEQDCRHAVMLDGGNLRCR